MSTEAKEKNKGGIIAIWALILALLATGGYFIYRHFHPTVAAMKKYIQEHGIKTQSDQDAWATVLPKMSDDELFTAYQAIKDFTEDKPIPADLQSKMDALTAKYGIFG